MGKRKKGGAALVAPRVGRVAPVLTPGRPARRQPLTEVPEIERLVLALCRAVAECHGDRWLTWCGYDQVRAKLPALNPDQLEALIQIAADRGLLSIGGRPAHSLLLSAPGRALIERG